MPSRRKTLSRLKCWRLSQKLNHRKPKSVSSIFSPSNSSSSVFVHLPGTGGRRPSQSGFFAGGFSPFMPRTAKLCAPAFGSGITASALTLWLRNAVPVPGMRSQRPPFSRSIWSGEKPVAHGFFGANGMVTTAVAPGAIAASGPYGSVDPSLLSRRNVGCAGVAPVFFTATRTCMSAERSQNAACGLMSCAPAAPSAKETVRASLKT